MQLNALIVDDEEHSRKSLYYLLNEHCPEIQIKGIASSIQEATEYLQEHDFHIVFLDIAMPGKNGFDLVPLLLERHICIVFVTAYSEYALKALKSNAVDYLLKPIDIEELLTAVEKCKNIIKERQQHASVLSPIVSNNGSSAHRKISLYHNQGFDIINSDDIIYVEADSNYSVIHLEKDKKIVVAKSLKDIEDLLPANVFFRVHKSSIVNLNKIKSFSSRNDPKILLTNGAELLISRRRLAVFQEHIKAFTKA